MSYPIVLAIWHDAHETQHDIPPEEIIHEPMVQQTVGFLIRRDKLGITLATEHGSDGNLRTTNFIPAGMIQRVRKLKAV